MFFIISGCHQGAISRQLPPSQPSVNLLSNFQSAFPPKNHTNNERLSLTERTMNQVCIGRNNVSIIGDRIKTNLNYKCPNTPSSVLEINTPASFPHVSPLEIPGLQQTERLTPGLEIGEKLAKNEIMRIRRRGMKKHRRKRRIKRMWPMLRKKGFLKFKKKQMERKALFAKIAEKAEKFDAYEHIKSKLKVAKEQGFYVNIFNDKAGLKFTEDVRKKKEVEEWKTYMQKTRNTGQS